MNLSIEYHRKIREIIDRTISGGKIWKEIANGINR